MEQLNSNLVSEVARFLNGKRLEKFQASVAALNTAAVRGAWESRERQKSESGFYQGISDKISVRLSRDFDVVGPNDLHQAEMCLCFGRLYSGPIPRVYVDKSGREVPAAVVEAWFKLCGERHELVKQLDAARPKPVVTAIGLSPKVTKTLTEMNLDIDLPTIKPAEIEAYKVQTHHPKTFEPLFEKDGVTPIMETAYRVKWSRGIKLGLSRFHSGCEACGKPIPSGRYVPIEAGCKTNGRIGLWIGVDCARNIFGIKDQGIAR